MFLYFLQGNANGMEKRRNHLGNDGFSPSFYGSEEILAAKLLKTYLLARKYDGGCVNFMFS